MDTDNEDNAATAAGNAKPAPEDEKNAASKALMEKILAVLTSTAPESWRIGGADLTPEYRSTCSVQVHEQIIVRDVPQGTLALHLVQPVLSVYVPGGYRLDPNGTARYTVELRDRIFDASKVVDPRLSASQKGKKIDILASGDVAKKLFLDVRSIVHEFSRNLKKDFHTRAVELQDHLPEKVDKTEFSAWKKTVEELGDEEVTRYTTEIDGLEVEITCRSTVGQAAYSAAIRLDKFSHEQIPAAVAANAYTKLHSFDQHAQLTRLEATLNEIGLDKPLEDKADEPEQP